jgi:hypothetical protein
MKFYGYILQNPVWIIPAIMSIFFDAQIIIIPSFSSNSANMLHFPMPQDGLEGAEAEQAQQLLDGQRAQYFYELSQRLEPTIPTKFWA